jgi:hypothetical protein
MQNDDILIKYKLRNSIDDKWISISQINIPKLPSRIYLKITGGQKWESRSKFGGKNPSGGQAAPGPQKRARAPRSRTGNNMAPESMLK